MTPDDPRHGTENGYGNLRCRCDRCREAHRVYFQGQRARMRSMPLRMDDPRHGTSNLYGNYGCRCRPCTDAWARDAAYYRRKRQSA